MPIAEIISRGKSGRWTRQQLADMALSEDRAARAARARGDMEAAAGHDRESAALCRMMEGN